MKSPRIALIGVSGYSRVHLEHLWPMHLARSVVIVGAVVINPDAEEETCRSLTAIDCRLFPDVASLVSAQPTLKVDLCIVPSPIHLHPQHAIALLGAGVHVLVEKPLAATVKEVDEIAAAAAVAERSVAVGFQYLHAAEVQALKRRLVDGAIGKVRRIAVHASWPRSRAYYRRSDWAGRVSLKGEWVFDSPIANAMAHFFMLLLHFAGDREESGAEVRRMSAELYRAQDIESFDTAVVAMETTSGCRLEFYGTHSARTSARPKVVLEGDDGRAEWVQDSHATTEGLGGHWKQLAATESSTRERMLRDVLENLCGQHRFVCTPALAREHVRCVNALHTFGRIVPIPATSLAQYGEEPELFTYVEGLDLSLESAARQQCSLRDAGATWAQPPHQMDLQNFLKSPPGEQRQP